MKGWLVITGQDGKEHVEPDRDMRPHRHSIDCWCHPNLDDADNNVVIHHAMDGREERGGTA